MSYLGEATSKTKQMKHLFLLGLLAILFSGCSKDDDVDYGPIDEQLIKDYLEENDLEAQRHSSGLYYHIITPGTGNNVYPNARVTIRYTGKLLDGTVFDSGKLTDYPLSNLIPAWKIGIPMLKKGGKAIFYCPSALAYGSQVKPTIPANSVLIFDVEVIHFQ